MIKNRLERNDSFVPPAWAASGKEGLSRYVRRLLAEKSLSLADVELRANGKISDSRIAGLIAGDCDNLRCETLRALAKGLGVAEERLFAVAIGAPVSEVQEYDFLVLYGKYKGLGEAEQREIDGLLMLLHREIERLLRRHDSSDRRFVHSPAENGQDSIPQRLPETSGLKAYLCRMLKEKGLTLKEIEQRSQQKISVSYLRNIVFDGMSNLTIEKIRALACGLEVSPEEIFATLEDHTLAERRDFKSSRFAALYYQYKALATESKKELRLLMKLVDGEIDRRQMQQLRRTDKRKYSAA